MVDFKHVFKICKMLLPPKVTPSPPLVAHLKRTTFVADVFFGIEKSNNTFEQQQKMCQQKAF